MTSDALEAWVRARDRYTSQNVARRSRDELAYQRGRRPVLVTALHATEHRRLGSRKAAEPESGALAQALAETSGYACLTAIGPQTGDANWDLSHPFRDRVGVLLDRYGLVLDLHMMLDSHGPGACLGLGPLPNHRTGRLASLAAHEAEACALSCTINWPFPAAPRTLTAFVQSRSASAVQIEIASGLQRPTEEPAQAGRLLDWLGRLDSHIAALWGW